MTRADALRKLLAHGGLYHDEIYAIMGGDREQVLQAMQELAKAGEIQPVNPARTRQKYTLKTNPRHIAMPRTQCKTALIGSPWN